ncbi:MAG: hypothetical protein ACR2FH_01945 [Caulobacteraceae bacterium]
MNGEQFIRRARKWARVHGVPEHVDPSRGKGGHVTQTIGERYTMVKTGEIGTGLLHAMLKQLGIPRDEF